MIFTTEGFLEVVIESWPEWDLIAKPLNSIQMLQSTDLGYDFNLQSEKTMHSYSNNFISLFNIHISF